MGKSVDRIKELIEILNNASKAYYTDNIEIMSNFEYDKLYDELVGLENENNIVLSNSPTQNVGYELLESLPKERHASKMLSLDKTKDINTLRNWLEDEEGILSYKVDGLTIVLTYENGKLAKAVTRGRGEEGEVVTENAKMFKEIPLVIPFKENLVVRGEAYIGYGDFEKINNLLDVDEQYKNPRNLCSGSVRQLNTEITKQRNVSFVAFDLITKNDEEKIEGELKFLKKQGFEVVPYEKVISENIEDSVGVLTEQAKKSDIPTDGLVLIFDDIKYGMSLGATSKFPKNAIAFKWQDETAKTVLREIEWSPSRTGLINPVAIFDPVELESTIVSRASVHNLSILKELNLVVGDEIEVYKANMIIPQISRNLKKNFVSSEAISIPTLCPICQEKAVIKDENSVETLVCVNPECAVKKIKEFVHFMNRDAMNVDGISEATIEKLIEKKFIEKLSDIFELNMYENEISEMEGFGKKSFENMIASIEKSKTVEMYRFLFGLGIGGIGLANARLIADSYNENWEALKNAKVEELIEINGVGPVMAQNFVDYFSKEKNKEEIESIMKYISFKSELEVGQVQHLLNKTFVITGSTVNFENRSALKAYIEKFGGKVSSSVSKNTTYLINNDKNSNSSKNKTAKNLGVEIIGEEELLELTKG